MGALSGLTREQVSAKLAADTATFLANGGKIKQLEYDDRAERRARVGRWMPLGTDDEFGVLFDDPTILSENPEWDATQWDEHYDPAGADVGDWHCQYEEASAFRDYLTDCELDNDDETC